MVDPGLDPETGLQYNQARYYDPTTGPRRRWPVRGPHRVVLVLLAAAGAAAAIIVISHSLWFVAFAVVCVALSIVPFFRS